MEVINMAKQKTLSQMLKEQREIEESREARESEWYNLRPILGNANWAIFYFLIGGREAGKSYAVTNFFVDQFINKGIPFYWFRLTDTQAAKLLKNNAEKLVDPDLRRKYNLDLVTKGDNVYHVTKRSKPDKDGKTKVLEKKFMARVMALSTFYNDKGSIFDKDFLKDPKMRYNVAIDEFQREKNEKRTFDILYGLTNQLENNFRSVKDRIKIFFMGNTLEECSEILSSFNFLPQEFGIFKLKSKRALIHYIEPSKKYLERRKGTIADLLMPTASTFTNKIDTDTSLIYNGKLGKPQYVIKFTKDKKDWFTLWDKGVICPYNSERKPVIAMRMYIDEVFNLDAMNQVIALFNTRSYRFKNSITFVRFQSQLELLKPSR